MSTESLPDRSAETTRETSKPAEAQKPREAVPVSPQRAAELEAARRRDAAEAAKAGSRLDQYGRPIPGKPGETGEKKDEEEPSRMMEMLKKGKDAAMKMYGYLAEQGTEVLKWIAEFLRSMKWEGLAKLVDMLAGSDRAALKEALNANGVKLKEPVINPELGESDPAYKEELRKFNVGTRQLSSRCKQLKYGNDKVDFYNKVMAKLPPNKPEYTIEDLVAAAMQVEVNPTPTPTPQKPEAPGAENALALDKLPANTNLMSDPSTKLSFEGDTLAVRFLADGVLVVENLTKKTAAKRYKLGLVDVKLPQGAKKESVKMAIKKAVSAGADGMTMDSTCSFEKTDGSGAGTSEFNAQKLKVEEVKKVLAEIGKDSASVAFETFQFMKA